jgi:hypothetical protein
MLGERVARPDNHTAWGNSSEQRETPHAALARRTAWRCSHYVRCTDERCLATAVLAQDDLPGMRPGWRICSP